LDIGIGIGIGIKGYLKLKVMEPGIRIDLT
jgi:hypothetical protein